MADEEQKIPLPLLPYEMVYFIYDYLENNENRLSLALSGAIPLFDEVYRQRIRYPSIFIIAEHNLYFNISIFMSNFQYHPRCLHQLQMLLSWSKQMG